LSMAVTKEEGPLAQRALSRVAGPISPRPWTCSSTLASRRRNGGAERRWAKQIVNRSNGPDAIQLMECLEIVDVERRLSEISLPTLILHGRRDVITAMANAETLAAKIPNSKLVVIEDAGHVPTITRPAVVAKAIDEFFA